MVKLPIKPDFSDKTAVVTGGAGVLCSEFARALAACGAKVAVLDLSEEGAAALAADIQKEGGRAIGLKADVLRKESLEEARAKVKEVFGPCDILINGAGGNAPGATTQDEFFDAEMFKDPDGQCFFDLEAASVDRVFGLNFTGTFLPTQVFAEEMPGRQGVILNVSSMNAFTPLTKIPAYSAAKAAISNFTQWLAVYFAKCGIRVNALAPGFFSTAQNKALLWNEDGSPSLRAEKILHNTPMGRFGVPEDLTGTVLYLLSNDCAAFVTGVVVPVDGGFAAYSGV